MKSFLAALALCLPLQAFASGYSFTPLRDMGYENDTYPVGISDNGQRVYGYTLSNGIHPNDYRVEELFLWDKTSGLTYLPSLQHHNNYLVPTAISGDGNVVTGYVGHLLGAISNFKWTQADGYTSLNGGLVNTSSPLMPTALSYDGSIVAGEYPSGLANPIGFVLANGQYPNFSDLRSLGQGANPVYVNDISGAGDKVVGKAKLYEQREVAFLWTPLTGYVILEPLNELHNIGEAISISASGEYVLAQAYLSLLPSEQEWFIWNETEGSIPISIQDESILSTNFKAVSDSGLIVGSAGYLFFAPPRALLWDAEHGHRFLDDILVENDIDLLGWQLMGITDVTPDGQTLVGYGETPDGRTEAFIVTIPEPLATLWLLPLGLIALVCYRRTK